MIDALGEVSGLLKEYGGEWGWSVAIRVDEYRLRLAVNDLEALGAVLADTTGGMGSLRDVALTPAGGRSNPKEERAALQDRHLAASANAAEKCRIAMRRHGLEVWR
ncbi:MAG: hypothetical protein ACT6RD_11780 [Brevundimonas sp.]|uniref:hypothetical protein n=1 Tax=Brevundimonas sp. TaxID=1871086 RepID=UPI004034C27D